METYVVAESSPLTLRALHVYRPVSDTRASYITNVVLLPKMLPPKDKGRSFRVHVTAGFGNPDNGQRTVTLEDDRVVRFLPMTICTGTCEIKDLVTP